MELKENNGRLEIELPGVLDLPTASELRDILLDALSRDSAADVVLKGGAVERIATACIQVVLAAATGFRLAARQLEVENASEAMASAFRHLGLGDDLAKLNP